MVPRQRRARVSLLLGLLLLLVLPSTVSRKGSKSAAIRRSRKTTAGGLQASLVAQGDPVLSAAQHAELGEARELVQSDIVGGIQSYMALAQHAMAAGELIAAERVLAEGLAVIDAAGPEAEFLGGSLLMVQASVLKCSNRAADALESFDRMARLLPTDLGPDPERQEGVRSLFRLDLLRTLLYEATLEGAGVSMKVRKALQRRRKTEEEALLRGGPWTSLAQLPRDYQSGLRARPWWNIEAESVLPPPAASRLLETLRAAREALIAEHAALVRSGKMAPERECIHDSSDEAAGEWTQYDFLGGAAGARQRAASSTAMLLSRPHCERGFAPAGCAAAAAVETVLRQAGWGGA